MPPPESLRALLAGVIDYAGMFPPASLPLVQSILRYARYARDRRESGDRWMLGRFVCPAAQLAELADHARERFTEAEPLSVVALGRGGDGDFAADLRQDLQAIAAFRRDAGARANVEIFETRLPPVVPSMRKTLEAVESACRDARLRAFCEAAPGTELREQLPDLARDLATHGLGFKLRTGGADAAAFPPAELLAFAIVTCRDAGIPVKFTAGLHHPAPRRDERLGVTMHGFLNVLVACVMASALRMDEHHLLGVLEDEDPAAFTFESHRLLWGQRAVPTPAVAAARRQMGLTFGSCSFDEPRDDLRAMRLI